MQHKALNMSTYLGNVPRLRGRFTRLWQHSTAPPTDVTSWVCIKVGQVCWLSLVKHVRTTELNRHVRIKPSAFLSTAYFLSCCGTCLTGDDHDNNPERKLISNHRRKVPPSTDTEMRDNYRQPKQRPEMLHCSMNPKVACRGIGTENLK